MRSVLESPSLSQHLFTASNSSAVTASEMELDSLVFLSKCLLFIPSSLFCQDLPPLGGRFWSLCMSQVLFFAGLRDS